MTRAKRSFHAPGTITLLLASPTAYASGESALIFLWWQAGAVFLVAAATLLSRLTAIRKVVIISTAVAAAALDWLLSANLPLQRNLIPATIFGVGAPMLGSGIAWFVTRSRAQ